MYKNVFLSDCTDVLSNYYHIIINLIELHVPDSVCLKLEYLTL